MKKGLLIVNAFLNSEAVRVTYDALLAGAARAGIEMELSVNSDYFVDMADGRVKCASPDVSARLADAGFILFWNKDVFLGRALERAGYRLFNSALGIEYCDNKALTFEMLEGIVRMPRTFKIPMTFETIGYTSYDFEKYLGDTLGYPYVIKECYGSYGGQVYLAGSQEEAHEILKRTNGRECLAQKFIETSRGRDLRAYVVGDRVVASMVRSNANDFRSNIENGGSGTGYDITKEQEEMAVAAVHKLGLDFAGVDILFGEDDEPLLCEVNSNAQFKGLKDATGVDVTDALFEYIKRSCNQIPYTL
ncbi:MAG: RimK family alpha-L-glutamate ligase [Lachnospiraceae bacterium]|nr:RimK family alpha-L-glutamate ligase [Lachnospiraceae bacterium]